MTKSSNQVDPKRWCKLLTHSLFTALHQWSWRTVGTPKHTRIEIIQSKNLNRCIWSLICIGYIHGFVYSKRVFQRLEVQSMRQCITCQSSLLWLRRCLQKGTAWWKSCWIIKNTTFPKSVTSVLNFKDDDLAGTVKPYYQEQPLCFPRKQAWHAWNTSCDVMLCLVPHIVLVYMFSFVYTILLFELVDLSVDMGTHIASMPLSIIMHRGKLYFWYIFDGYWQI